MIWAVNRDAAQPDPTATLPLSAFDHWVDGVAVFDLEGRYLYVNDAAEHLAGLPRGRLLGARIWDLYPDIVGNPLWRAFEALRDGAPAQRIEIPYPTWGRVFQSELTCIDGGRVFALGAIVGLTTVILVLLYGQSRIFFTISKDGLLPPLFAAVHPRLGTPHRSLMMIGAIVAVVAALTPIGILGEMVSIGTLFAFVMVCGAVLYLRRSDAHVARPFRTPGVPFVPVAGVLFCGLLMIGLPFDTWMRLLIWLAIGLVVYFGYGRHHSVLRKAATPA